MGLREAKKQQTRTAIADAAAALFFGRGFDQVSVAEVARAAGVSVNTVFNYFPAKEDLFFDRRSEVEQHLATVVRTAPAGVRPADAVRADLLAAIDRADPYLGLSPDAATFWRVVHDSPALLARAREIAEQAEAALAEVLVQRAAAPPQDALPHLCAGAIAGAYRAVVAEIRRQMLDGRDPDSVRDDVRTATVRAFDTLSTLVE
ncbi:TetR/AcrR family transcriptional regulator [Streptomyces sp. NPDC021224]|uniref:TetR/AcrR family transcriptional regulator n=1 Tax=unclassified Streptomyces TaxID=2593676 RepID=UPI0037B8A7E2